MSLFAEAAYGAAVQDLVYGGTIGFEPRSGGAETEFVAAGPDSDRPAKEDRLV